MNTKDGVRLKCRESLLASPTAIALVGVIVQSGAVSRAAEAATPPVTDGRSQMIPIVSSADSSKRVRLPMADGPMACPCWNDYTHPKLLDVLRATVVAA